MPQSRIELNRWKFNLDQNEYYLGALGELIYDNFGDPHTPYVAAANETMERLGTKRMYGGSNNTFRSIAEINARKLSSKTLK